MRYSKLVEVYEKLSSTSKRLEKIEILANFLEIVDNKNIIYLLTGEIFPEYENKKIGINEKLVIKSLSKATGIKEKLIVEKWRKIGDLGEVAKELINQKKQTTLQRENLSVEKVIENLRKLPELEGKGAISKKILLITEILVSASEIESKYIIRTLLRDLRIGVQESTIRDALVKSFFPNSKEEATEKIQDLIDSTNDLAEVFEIAKKRDLKQLSKIKLEIGKPIKAMLAQKASSIEEGFEKLGKPCAFEYKYDGFRVFIHKKDFKVILFTRKLENVTKQFPEVVEYVNNYINGNNFIIDSEIVGYDKNTKKYAPFQAISQRIKRKYDIDKLKEELPVEVNVFDIIYYNGKSLINETFEKRTRLLRSIVKEVPYKIKAAEQKITDDIKEAEKFYQESLKKGQEGIMMKNLNAEYKPGRRVGNMLKFKPEEKDFDLVITGAEYGTGKRAGYLTSFILSCKNNDKFLEVGKVSTGLKEKNTNQNDSYEELTKLLEPLIKEKKGKNVKIKPEIVIAVTYQEIQKSSNYSSGLALRFPRFVALRLDKSLDEITTLEEIQNEFKKFLRK